MESKSQFGDRIGDVIVEIVGGVIAAGIIGLWTIFGSSAITALTGAAMSVGASIGVLVAIVVGLYAWATYVRRVLVKRAADAAKRAKQQEVDDMVLSLAAEQHDLKQVKAALVSEKDRLQTSQKQLEAANESIEKARAEASDLEQKLQRALSDLVLEKKANDSAIEKRDRQRETDLSVQDLRIRQEAKREQEAAIRVAVSEALARKENADIEREAKRELSELIDVTVCIDPSRGVVFQRGGHSKEDRIHVEFGLRFSNRSTRAITLRKIDAWTVQIYWPEDGTVGPPHDLRTVHLDSSLRAGANEVFLGDTIKDDMIVINYPPRSMLGTMQVVGRLTSDDGRSMMFRVDVQVQLLLGYTPMVEPAAARIRAELYEHGIYLADLRLWQVKRDPPGDYVFGWHLTINPRIELPCDTYSYNDALSTATVDAVIKRALDALGKRPEGTK